ncbi:MAG: LytTR family DNA-binding domain-containing protein [Ferruginibacter sp.]
MEKINTVLVDDEINSLQSLEQKLQECCPDIHIMAALQKPEEAIDFIKKHPPELLFLDIEMPRMNGFKMLDYLSDYSFEIIFTTAYNHYAVDAIRISAFDYLVKPIVIKDLQNAVARFSSHKKTHTSQKLDILKQRLSNGKSQDDKIGIASNEVIEFLQIKDIIRVESLSNYSKIFLMNGATVLVSKSLKDFDEMLTSYGFFRLHNSHLINMSYIKKYIKSDGGQVVMQNGDLIDVSRRKKDEFFMLLKDRI